MSYTTQKTSFGMYSFLMPAGGVVRMHLMQRNGQERRYEHSFDPGDAVSGRDILDAAILLGAMSDEESRVIIAAKLLSVGGDLYLYASGNNGSHPATVDDQLIPAGNYSVNPIYVGDVR